MPTIYLMRHAHALSFEESPFRALSAHGVESAQKVAEFLKKNQLPIHTIFHSSVERSKQTAEILAKELALEHTLTLFPFLDPDTDVTQLLKMLADLGDKVLLVGHLPNLELLSNYLLTYDYQHPTINYLPASLAAFQLRDNTCLLEWFIHPGLI